jgi:hyaluronan synthase
MTRRSVVSPLLTALGVVGVVILGAYTIERTYIAGGLKLDPFATGYALLVLLYVASRFGVALLYRPGPDRGFEPNVAVVVPAFNEEAAIEATVDAILALDYPEAKLEVVVIDDGSTDGTGFVISQLARENPRVRAILFPENRGKRAAMAAGIRTTSAEILAFVDSDSVLEPDALHVLVQDFADRDVGAVAGHADVLNEEESFVARMQAVRYFVAFRVFKAAESVFGAVSCCSGCFSAYRREAILPSLGDWENQMFLGRSSTFGDDRSLTNFVLLEWRVVYQARAISRTIVPTTCSAFVRQQARWKRSWTRESLVVARFFWRKHPAAVLPMYASIVLPLLAPFSVLRALLWQPLVTVVDAPLVYLCGLATGALLYGLYFELRARRGDGLWLFGILFGFFYVGVLVWQTYYAICTSRTAKWGTRAASAPAPSLVAEPALAA